MLYVSLRSLFVHYLVKVTCTEIKEEFEITNDYCEVIPDTINEFNSCENGTEKSYIIDLASDESLLKKGDYFVTSAKNNLEKIETADLSPDDSEQGK